MTMPTEHVGDREEESTESSHESPRILPNDLPTSLDDRRILNSYAGETEMYDGWQGTATESDNQATR